MSLTRPQTARAWVNFNGVGTIAIRDSYNVSSLTDEGVGDYTINFSTALTNNNYATMSSTGVGTTNIRVMGENASNILKTTTALRLSVLDSTTSAISRQDVSLIYVSIFGV